MSVPVHLRHFMSLQLIQSCMASCPHANHVWYWHLQHLSQCHLHHFCQHLNHLYHCGQSCQVNSISCTYHRAFRLTPAAWLLFAFCSLKHSSFCHTSSTTYTGAHSCLSIARNSGQSEPLWFCFGRYCFLKLVQSFRMFSYLHGNCPSFLQNSHSRLC